MSEELLKQILKELKELKEKVSLLDKNVKNIANSAKVSELIEKTLNTSLDTFARTSKNTNKINKDDIPTVKATGRKSVMATGKLKTIINNEEVGLNGITIKIYDHKDNLVKNTRSNYGGKWMCQLAPGKYVASFEGEHKGKKLIPVNKAFVIPDDLPEDMLEYEVK